MVLGYVARVIQLVGSKSQRDDGCTSEDTIGETGTRMLPVPRPGDTAFVHAGHAEIEVPSSCDLYGQVLRYDNPDVLIAISYVNYTA